MNAIETMSSGDEAELLARLRAGDEDAFETLVRTHGGRMLAVARRMLRRDEDSADAVQEALVSAFRSLDGFAGQSSLGTWLHRIVVNACLMKLRSRSRRKELAIEGLLPTFDETGHHTQPVRAWSEPAGDILVRDETRAWVRSCIDQLPEAYRTILLLRDIEELDTEATAEALGIKPGAVKTRLHRARQALRALLDPALATPA